MESTVKLNKLPFPPSLWKLYWGEGRNRNKTTEYRIYIAEQKMKLRKLKVEIPKAFGYTFYLEYHSPTWITKAGKVRKKDVENYKKGLIDPLTNFYKDVFDDAQIFDLRSKKIYSQLEYVDVWISPLDSLEGYSD